MSIKLKRYQSEESGPFSKTGRKLASVKIPGNVGFTDLENSSLVLNMTAKCIGNNGEGNLIPIVFGERFDDIGPIRTGGASSLIRHAKVKSDNNPNIYNQQKDQNVVNGNLDWYLNTREEDLANDSFNSGGSNSTGRFPGIQTSQFLKTVKPTVINAVAVTDLSEAIRSEVRIPMKHIDLFARSIRQFPNVSVGDLTYEFEFETYKDVITNANPIPILFPDQVSDGASNFFGNAAAPLIWRQRASDATLALEDIDSSPWYVGCPLGFSYTDNGAKTANSTIESLKATDAGIEIVLTTPLPATGTGVAGTTIIATQYISNDATFEWSIDEVFLEMHELQLTPKQFEQTIAMTQNLSIPWMEYRLQKKTMAASAFYSDNILVDPLCLGLFILTPKSNQLTSSLDTAIRYRFTIDGTPVDDRDIPLGPITNPTGTGAARQLQNYKLIKFMENMGFPLKRFDTPKAGYDNDADLVDHTHHMYPLVLPIKSVPQIVSIELNASGAMAQKDVYYVMLYQRELKFKNGKAV